MELEPRPAVAPPPPLHLLLADRHAGRDADPTAITHTSLAGGRYSVPSAWLPTFYRSYAAAIERGERLALVERRRHIGPVVIDLDLRQLPGAPACDGHLYERDDVRRFVSLLEEQLGKLVELPSIDAPRRLCFVLEKPPRLDKHGALKDGIHFVVPSVVGRAELLKALRTAMLPATENLFAGKCTGPGVTAGATAAERAAAIFDESVFDKNGWLMLGSRKVDKAGGKWEPHAWAVTRVFRFEDGAGPPHELPEATVASLTATPEARRSLVRLLSVRNKFDETSTTAEGATRIETLVREGYEARMRSMEAEAMQSMHSEAMARGDDAAASAPVGDDALAALVALLSPERAVPYGKWYPVGQCLANVTGKSDAGLALFHAFSRRADEAPSVPAAAGDGNGVGDGAGAVYDSRSCDTTWRGLTVRPANKLGMGSLCWWANEDDPDGYKAWQAAHGRAQDISGGLHPLRTRVPPELRVAIFDQCAAQWPDIFSAAAIDAFTLEHDEAGLCFSFGEGGGGTISRDGLVVTLADGRVLGSVLKNTPLNRSLAFMHANVPTTINEYVLNCITTEQSQIDSRPPGTSLTLYHGPSPFVNINSQGRQARVAVREKVSSLSKMLGAALLDHARNTLGVPAANAIFFINNGTIVIGDGAPAAGGNIKRPRADDVLAASWIDFNSAAAGAAPNNDEHGQWQIVYNDGKYYYVKNGLWHCTANNDMASNHLVKAMKAVHGGQFWTQLSPEDQRYIGSTHGGMNMLKRMLNDLENLAFPNILDSKLNLLPFSNGVLELWGDFRFRPLRWDDYVSMTTGYPFTPYDQVPLEQHEFVARMYREMLPVEEEREVFQRLMGAALTGAACDKKFIVLTDVLGGNNGKSIKAEMMKQTFGNFGKADQKAILYTSSSNNPNAHAANIMHYKGARLAVFDETSGDKRFDMDRLKMITSGGELGVRGAHEGSVTEFRWTAFVFIACNKTCLPQFDATDAAFINRMVPVPMRAKYDDTAAQAGKPNSYPMDVSLKLKVPSLRWASLHVLLAALKRYQAAGSRITPGNVLPPGCLELRAGLVSAGDRSLDAINEVLDDRVDFDPPHPVNDEQDKPKGGRPRTTHSISRDKLVKIIKLDDRFRPFALRITTSKVRDLLDTAMLARGKLFREDTTVGGVKVYGVYINCSIKLYEYAFDPLDV